MTVQQRLRC